MARGSPGSQHLPPWLSHFILRVEAFAKGFLGSLSDKELDTLAAQVHTSVGQTIEIKPEKELVERLRKVRKDG